MKEQKFASVWGVSKSQLRRLAKTWGEWEERDVQQEAIRLGYEVAANIKTSFCNNRYHVQVYEIFTNWGIVQQASLGRHGDIEPITWDELQRIKNELFGEDKTAIEVYPTTKHLVCQAPMRHLWILPGGFELPFGLHLKSAWGKEVKR